MYECILQLILLHLECISLFHAPPLVVEHQALLHRNNLAEEISMQMQGGELVYLH